MKGMVVQSKPKEWHHVFITNVNNSFTLRDENGTRYATECSGGPKSLPNQQQG